MVNSNAIAKEFSIPRDMAREIVADETRRVLLSSWQLWLLLVASLSLAIWLYMSVAPRSRFAAVLLLSGGGFLWHMIGRHLASPAIRNAAQSKSTRIHGKRP